jgi:hypothetical protein
MKHLCDNSIISDIWANLEANSPQPDVCTGLETLEYEKFEKIFLTQNYLLLEEIIKKLYLGKIYIIKNSFDEKFVNKIKNDFLNFTKSKPSEFHKMKENCPDFHRIIDEEVTNLYSMRAIKHSAYFFPWNKNQYNLFPAIYKKWRLLKFLGGRKYDEFENNTPINGVVDRIQVLRYPVGGELVTHSDPFHNQRMFISIYLSKRDKDSDYQEGGFYSLGNSNDEIDLEPYIDAGDIGFGYATIKHGVKKINGNSTDYDWESKKGRWFIGLYSNDSDEISNRKTSKATSEK